MPTLGERLRQLRNENNLKRVDIAKILKVTDRSITHYESGQRNLDQNQLIVLADFFDVSIDYLVGRSDEPQRR